MAKIIVLGGGPMGLAAAYFACRAGHEVDVLEADTVAGGMAAHFDFGGLSIERFYHFVCKADAPTFALMRELGLQSAMRWVPTSMGYFMKGRIHKWGDPISLLRFPHLSLITKIRYGLQMFLSTKRSDWRSLDKIDARTWIERWAGREAYDVLWRRLFDLKFFEFAGNLSAAWIWTRIKRVGTSRRSLFQEELGYIDGGSQTLVNALCAAIIARGGRIHLGHRAERVESSNGCVSGVLSNGRLMSCDALISTIPIPLIPDLVPDLSPATRNAYALIPNIGVVCVLVRLAQSVSPHFWLNIVDPDIDIPGIIEFSRLRRTSDHIVYVPYYMPSTHGKWAWSDAQFREEVIGYLLKLNPTLSRADVLDVSVGRLRYAQPVCAPEFLKILPPIQTEIIGLQIADTCFYYPEDRGIAESIRLAELMVTRLPAAGL